MIAAASLNINGYSHVSTIGSSFGNSPPIHSNQQDVHPRLHETVTKHLASEPRNVASQYNVQAYEHLRACLEKSGRPLILDSFCGTATSTALLAKRFSDHFVVGIDKSAHRLGKQEETALENALLLRADCEPLWQMLVRDDIHPKQHYLLYPNPWPKSKHLMRRVHGHPAFRYLVELGGTVELRSNWRIYIDEFDAAMRVAGLQGTIESVPTNAPALSRFEAKLRASEHRLWRYHSSGEANQRRDEHL